ncbi:MAG: VapB-type antitoxin [Nitrososphaeria archaeon]|nr:VapB-type antitoxin [Nitrososphaeria archaeon]
MSIIRVDSRGRMVIPKEIGVRDTNAIIIPAESFLVVIPLPKVPGGGWLITKKSRRELKDLAEKLGRKDAIERVKRRKKIDD